MTVRFARSIEIAQIAKTRGHRAGTRREAPLRWRQMAPSLLLIAFGIALVNQVELERLRADPGADLGQLIPMHDVDVAMKAAFEDIFGPVERVAPPV